MTTPLDRWKWAYTVMGDWVPGPPKADGTPTERPQLSAIERAVLLRAAYHARPWNESESTIAKVLGYNRQAVNAAHKKLERLGLIAVSRVDGRTNMRTILSKPVASDDTPLSESLDLSSQATGVSSQATGPVVSGDRGVVSGDTNGESYHESNNDLHDDARADAAPDDDDDEFVVVIPESELRNQEQLEELSVSYRDAYDRNDGKACALIEAEHEKLKRKAAAAAAAAVAEPDTVKTDSSPSPTGEALTHRGLAR